ncbi:HlyD family secretion protein [Pseudoduganella plicata]|uniref:Secretion protein n=1 Tax=Pseudoduganella plicata TaxID=321984 RepID=A0AA88C968_9BURK|nr:HlyD family efflux transporter periplasmic adaptor subunit [Pseudoduganella plicata]GGY96654.1 secretion protein [Pseudoduganella plicata]
MQSLFRQQAVDNKYVRFHGPIVLVHHWSNTALVLFLATIIVVSASFACLFGFTRKESVSGIVIPDKSLLSITAPKAGSLSGVLVREGQTVREGDALYVISSERTTAQGQTQATINDSVHRQIGRLQDELSRHERQAGAQLRESKEQIKSLHASLEHLDAELAAQRQKVQLLRDLSERMTDLAKEGSISRNTAALRAADLLEQQSRLASLEAQRLALLRDLSTARVRSEELPLQAERETSQLKRDILGKEQQASEGEARREVIVRALQSGRVAGLVARTGQPVVAGQFLSNIIPEGSVLEAELYVPTRAAGFVRPGTDVLLRYDAFPYQKFGQFKGVVREVALAAVLTSELRGLGGEAQAISNKSEPVYLMRVRLERQSVATSSGELPIKPGMQLSASLIMEHRTLAAWAFGSLPALAK